jgi:guanidinoacetate N-methyltransferase
MEKVIRGANYELKLTLRDEQFVSARQNQRDWLVKKSVAELADQLDHLDELASTLIAGGEQSLEDWNLRTGDATITPSGQLRIGDQPVMEDWQLPLMKRLACCAAQRHGRVLEIGFGLGLAAGFIQEEGIKQHTIVECSPSLKPMFDEWRAGFPGRDIRLILGTWQEVVDRLDKFDGILFDAYPLNALEYAEKAQQQALHSEFFSVAAQHLADDGVFTYYTAEFDSLSRGHQRALLQHFESVTIEVIEGLAPTPDAQTWWGRTMVVVEARRPKR